MNDDLLDDCLIIFIERDIFLNVKEEDTNYNYISETHYNM
jgi:hypothetical protein